MISEPFVEECVLAGPTPSKAAWQFRQDVDDVLKMHEIRFEPCRDSHVLGLVRVGPSLNGFDRYGACVHWWPVEKGHRR